jgi:hypothetical protein
MKITTVWLKHGVPHPTTKAHSVKLHDSDCSFHETTTGVDVYPVGPGEAMVTVPMGNVAAIVYARPAEPVLPSPRQAAMPVVVKGKGGKA